MADAVEAEALKAPIQARVGLHRVQGFRVQDLGLRVYGLRFRASACAGLNIHAPVAPPATPLPGICGRRHVLRPVNVVDIVQESIETGLSLNCPHATRHQRLPPKKLL